VKIVAYMRLLASCDFRDPEISHYENNTNSTHNFPSACILILNNVLTQQVRVENLWLDLRRFKLVRRVHWIKKNTGSKKYIPS
jgi:hypothetical protein